MTTPTHLAECSPVLSVRDTPAGSEPLVHSSAGADLPPDPSRDYFPAPVEFVLLDAHLLFGPLTPTPNVTLAEVVERIATVTA